jgi:LysR family tcuABC transcriptional regulator
MELRQLRYFVRVVELGSLSRAANDLRTVPSTLSQQISRLEGDLSVRLLERTARGVVPTAAGLEFFREAQLALRHANQAATVAQHARGSGRVSIGLAPSTAGVVGLPLLKAMRARYPDVRVHLMESPTGQLSSMLNARQIDLAVLFDIDAAWRWHVIPLAEEKIYLIESARTRPMFGEAKRIKLADLNDVPLILPSAYNGLRRMLNAAFSSAGARPRVIAEIDALATLSDAVEEGMGATLTAWAAIARVPDAASRYHLTELEGIVRRNSLCCLSEDELSMAALGARLALTDCVRELTDSDRWVGAQPTFHES